jgi:two-component system LytT family response regulator
MRCVVVEDEELGRLQLLDLIQQDSRLEVIGLADRSEKAVELINSLRPDVVFLDIQMPGGSGFDVVQQIHLKPQIIFVTAHDRYAVKAFEVAAHDYLLKPITKARFDASVDRVFTTFRSRASKASETASETVMVPVGSSGTYVPLADVLYVCSEGHYTVAAVAGGAKHRCRKTFREWLEHLPESVFLKVQRGLVINIRRVVCAELSSGGGYVRLGDLEESVEIGARGAERLMRYLNEER